MPTPEGIISTSTGAVDVTPIEEVIEVIEETKEEVEE